LLNKRPLAFYLIDINFKNHYTLDRKVGEFYEE